MIGHLLLKKNLRDKLDAGFTMVEMLAAVFVVSSVLVTILSGISYAVKNTRFSKDKTLSVRYSQEGLEWVRSQRDVLGWRGFYETFDEVASGTPRTTKICLDQAVSFSEAELLDDTGAWLGLGSQVSLISPTSPCTATIPNTDAKFTRVVTLTFDPADLSNVDVESRVYWQNGKEVADTIFSTNLNEWR